jgi:hypothetical protein
MEAARPVLANGALTCPKNADDTYRRAYCCWPAGAVDCPKPAAFDVWDEDPADPYSGTQVCAEHLAEACQTNGPHHHVNLLDG